MTKREAKQQACRQASAILDSHVACGSEFEAASEEDQKKITVAIDELAQELWERGNRRRDAGKRADNAKLNPAAYPPP